MGLYNNTSPLKTAKQDLPLQTTASHAPKLPWAQLFERLLVPTQGPILTQVSFSFIQKHFPG